jgi:ubiquinone/menaquinone biosynthesis C-methylase UbiE
MAAAYDNYDYPGYWKGREYEHQSEAIAIKNFFSRVGQNKKVLDIGSGYGRLTKIYREFSKQTTLADPSSKILKRAKAYLNGQMQSVNFVHSSLQNLPRKLKTKKYDVVILVRVMHHIKDPGVAINMASRYLPKGGFLILEFANKLHGKALFQNFINGNFTFPLDIFPLDKRSKKNINKNSILFLNHHPDSVEVNLKKNGFKIVDKRSVSNIRAKNVKRFLSLPQLVKLEALVQKPLARLNFGPSIFILAQKK